MSRPVLPVRDHLRPQRRRRVVTAGQLEPGLVARFPNIVAELNMILADVWEGSGRPGHGWEDWRTVEVSLDDALALPVAGEA